MPTTSDEKWTLPIVRPKMYLGENGYWLRKIKLVNTKHGFYSAEGIAERKYLRELMRMVRAGL